jgi:hypothetical protein
MQLTGERPNSPAVILHQGDLIKIDGSSGKVYLGEVPTVITGS